MQNFSPWRAVVLLASLGLVVSACAKTRGNLSVKIDGSSTVYPLTNAIAQSFEKREPVKVDVDVALKVNLGISGTGGGFKRFCKAEIDICNASRPIRAAEHDACKANGVQYVELPVAYDGLAVVVHPSNTWATSITTQELRKLWSPGAQGAISKWNQVRSEWPDEEIHLYGAGTDSGTYDTFNEVIVGKDGKLRQDYTASEDDDQLVAGVAGDRLALGFFGYAYLHKNSDKLKAVAIDDGNASNGAGPILPSPETVRNATYQPLSRPLFIYANKAALERREAELFVSYYLMNGAKFAEQLGYVPLPAEAYVLAQKRANARHVGSLFSGKHSEVALSVEQLLDLERRPLAQ